MESHLARDVKTTGSYVQLEAEKELKSSNCREGECRLAIEMYPS